MRIFYFCHWGALTGYGRAARDYIAALERYATARDAVREPIRIVDWTSFPGAAPAPPAVSPEPRYSHLNRQVVGWPTLADGDVAIYHGQPALLAGLVAQGSLPLGHAAALTVAMTTWETSAMPLDLAGPIVNGYDQVIVPSRHSLDAIDRALERSKRHVMHVVPHTFDPDFWVPTPRSVLSSGVPAPRDRPLRFYAVGAWSERKNHQAILRAYLHAFVPADNVSLTICAHGADSATVKALLGRSGLQGNDLPTLSVDPAPMHEQALHGLHDDHDVFVSASRAEGWGLAAFEAAVMGKVIISPIDSGEREFLVNGDYYAGLRHVASHRVPCFAGEGTPIIRDNAIVGEKSSRVPGMNCRQHWGDPSIMAIADRMRGLYGQHENGNYMGGASSRERLVARFGYDVVARDLTTLLQELTT